MEPANRKISTKLYLTAFILAIVIFASGIFIGMRLDEFNFVGITYEVDLLSQRIASIQLLMLMEGNSSDFCPVYKAELTNLDEEMQKIGYKLTFLESEKGVTEPKLKKQYFILETESYLLSERVKKLCTDNSSLIVYFYSNSNCSVCRSQGDEILKARDATITKKNVKIYSFDTDLDSPVVEALEKRYNVTTYPSIVINGVKYVTYRDSANITAIILNS